MQVQGNAVFSLQFRAKESLSDEDFAFVRAKIDAIVGIHLNANKRELVNGRLWRRVIGLRMDHLRDYVRFLRTLPPQHEEWQFFVNELTTNKTDFFREPEHFSFLRDVVLPGSNKEREIRIWSAACSSGEEPYTIAAVMNRYGKARGLDYAISASDVDTEVIAKARNGVYQRSSLLEVPEHFQQEMFTEGKGELSGWVRVRDELREHVTFRSCNLTQGPWPWGEKFDVIMCRNVFIYFSPETIANVCREMYECAEDGAYLLIGHSESLYNVRTPWVQIRPSIYRKMPRK